MIPLSLFLVLSAAALPAAVRLDPASPYLDIRGADWQYAVAQTGASQPADAASVMEWKPIRMGKRWDELGYPAMKFMTVWLRLRFEVPEELRGRKIGFFATLIDDEGDIWVNGLAAGRTVAHLGYALPEPANINLTPFVRFGGENELLVLLRDRYVRSPGIIGNVGLFHSLPFVRTPAGGLALTGAAPAGPLTLLLHVGAAHLSRAGRTAFSASELASLQVPPGILRDDELLLLAPAAGLAPAPHRVELDNVNPTAADGPLSISCGALPASVPRYGLLELPLEVSGTFTNPYDPRQISVQAVILTPSKRVERVFGFFQQDFAPVSLNAEEEILLPAKGPAWKVYYRPRELGTHQVEVFAQDRTGIRRHAAGTFAGVESALPGYLRISDADPRYFEYSNGDSFFAIGPSGWFRGPNYIFGGNPRWVPVRMMEEFYARKAANRSNYEYLGTFHYGRLLIRSAFMDPHIAWKLERTLRVMESHDIRWLFFHDDLRRYYRYGFESLPYSVAQGGPAVEINEYYTNEESLRWQRNQLRYLVARMADSPSIWIWNIGDEWRDQPGNKLSVPLVRSWMKELHEYVRSIDIYGRAHAIGEGHEAILNGGDVLPIEGWYLNHPPQPGNEWRKGRIYDLVSHVEEQVTKYDGRRFPVIDVEGGLFGWNAGIYHSGKPWEHPEGLVLHQHLWLSFFLKAAAGGTEWLVNVLDNDHQMFHAKAFAQYLDGEHLTRVRWERAAAEVSAKPATAWALQSPEKTLAWVLNRGWNWLDWVDGKRPATIQGATLKIPVAADGVYRVEVWDTFEGKVLSESRTAAKSRMLEVVLPSFSFDLALKCIRAAEK